ncbi:MAG: OsmC family protein [Ignavibacteria bacterium]|nr:OsmC family protein [Ignavibacteria bacterium]
MNSIHITWKHNLEFEAHQQGRTIELISSVNHDSSGKAVSPKQLLLTALAGCTGMDIASLLPKMRVPFTSITIRVNGTLSEEHPRVYTHIHVIYEVGAAKEFLPQIEKAVELSSSQYCGVSAMLRKAAEISSDIVLV